MSRFPACLLSLIWLLSPAAFACNKPREPSKVPNGSVVSESEMIAAMDTLRRYNTDVMNYVKCLDFEVAQNRIPRDAQISHHNEAVTKLQYTAERFNEQLKIYKQIHSVPAS